MRFGLDDAVLSKIVGVLEHSPDVEAAILYGSRAKGTHRPGSDIDLCLQGERLNLRALNRIATQLDDLLLPYTFDLCIRHQLDNPEFIAHIERVGQTVYKVLNYDSFDGMMDCDCAVSMQNQSPSWHHENHRARHCGMSEWEEIILRDIGKVITGKTPSKNNPEHWGTETLFITPTDFKIDSKYITQTERYLSKGGKVALKRLLLPKNSIIVTCIGSGMGKVAMVADEAITNQQLNSLVVEDKYNADFIFYKLRASYQQLRLFADGGSTMPIINKSTFEKLSLKIPIDKTEQQSIAAILSAIDNKIDLLRRQNTTLERLAQTLFTRWFVEFEFPVHLSASGFSGFGVQDDGGRQSCLSFNPENPDADKGYKSSGGAMAASELGEIPAGWRGGSFLELFDLLNGGTPKTSIPEYWDGDIYWLSGKDVTANHRSFIVTTEKRISEDGLSHSATKLLPKFTVVISARGTVGCYCMLSKEMCMSQTNYGIKAKIEGIHFFTYLCVSHIVERLKSQAYGSVFDTITTATFRDLIIAIPITELILSFEHCITPVFQKMLNNENQIQTLTHLRDALLPKLMSGQIRVRG